MSFTLVREMGLEPTRQYWHKHLKLACLPIPASPQISLFIIAEYRAFVKHKNWYFAILSPVNFLQISKTNSQSKPQNDKIMLDKPRSLCYNDYPNKGP